MARTAICPVCGKEFVPCQTNMSAFNWRRVCCCWECAEEYMARVEAERAKQRIQTTKIGPTE